MSAANPSAASPESSPYLYKGTEIPDYGDREYPYAVIEVTRHCNLRCKTCFFFQAFQHPEKNLTEDELIAKLYALQERHRIKFMSWVGGEPLLRPRVMAEAPKIFAMNVMFTNGTLPIPDLDIGIGVSLDGPQAINDEIRGDGVYDRVMATLAASPRSVFIQHVVTRRNAPVLAEFVETMREVPNVDGVVFSIYVPQKNDDSGLAFDHPQRDELIAMILGLKEVHGDFIFNERRALELAYSATSKAVTDHCDMKANSLALDYRLQRRTPCCYGEEVDCDLCAAPTPFSIAARREARAAGGPAQPSSFEAIQRAMVSRRSRAQSQ